MKHPYIEMSFREFKDIVINSSKSTAIELELEQLLAQTEIHTAFYPYAFEYYYAAESLKEKIAMKKSCSH